MSTNEEKKVWGLPDITKETHEMIFGEPWVIKFLSRTGISRKIFVDLMMKYSWETSDLSLKEYVENNSKSFLVGQYFAMANTAENNRRSANFAALESKGLTPKDVGMTDKDFAPLESAA